MAKTLTCDWNEWFSYHEQDPVKCLVGVNRARKPGDLKAVFETQSGLQIEGNVKELRCLEYAMLFPHRRMNGHTEVYDTGGMATEKHASWIEVCSGINLIHDCQRDLKAKEAMAAIQKATGIRFKMEYAEGHTRCSAQDMTRAFLQRMKLPGPSGS